MWKDRSETDMTIKIQEFNCNISPHVIIGKKGEMVRNIQEQTCTHISVLRDENKIVISSYDINNIKNAINIINNLSNNDQRSDQRYDQRSDQRYDQRSDQKSEEDTLNFNLDNFPSLGTKVLKKNTQWVK